MQADVAVAQVAPAAQEDMRQALGQVMEVMQPNSHKQVMVWPLLPTLVQAAAVVVVWLAAAVAVVVKHLWATTHLCPEELAAQVALHPRLAVVETVDQASLL